MASALYENIEDWQRSRDSENMEDLDGIINEIDPKQHSVGVTNENNADTETVKENGHHHNGLNGVQKEREDNSEKDDDDEPEDNGEETGCEETTPVPYYGKTLVAPEYMSFQISDDASQKEENDTKNNNTNDAAVAAGHSEKDQVEEEETSSQIDQIGLEEVENEDRFDENGDGNSITDGGSAINEEESTEVVPQLAQSEEDDDEESEDDEDDGLEENNDVNIKDEEDKDEDEEERSEDGGVDENDEEDGEDDEKERDDEIEEEVRNGGIENQCEDDEVEENIEENGVEEKEDDREEEEEHKKEVGADEEELSEEDDEERDKKDVVHHEHMLKESEDVEEVNQDEEIDTGDMAIKKEPTLEHWDSLKVNVASPTREIAEVSSAESLNEAEVEHTEDDDADEEAENTEGRDEKPRTTINGPVEVYDDQHNEDEDEEEEEIGREDENCQSDDSAGDDSDSYQDETKDGDKSDGEEDLKPVPEEEEAESEREAKDEDNFTVHKKLPVYEDESDLSGRVKELGRIFEGGGPIFPAKTAKNDSDAADGPPVSVRKFKAIFETDRYSVEKAREPGRREELSSPPSGIVKNLRGLFENPQSFEARKG